MSIENPPEERTVVMTCTPTEAKDYLNASDTIARLEKSLAKAEAVIDKMYPALKELKRSPYSLDQTVIGVLVDHIEEEYNIKP